MGDLTYCAVSQAEGEVGTWDSLDDWAFAVQHLQLEAIARTLLAKGVLKRYVGAPSGAPIDVLSDSDTPVSVIYYAGEG